MSTKKNEQRIEKILLQCGFKKYKSPCTGRESLDIEIGELYAWYYCGVLHFYKYEYIIEAKEQGYIKHWWGRRKVYKDEAVRRGVKPLSEIPLIPALQKKAAILSLLKWAKKYFHP